MKINISFMFHVIIWYNLNKTVDRKYMFDYTIVILLSCCLSQLVGSKFFTTLCHITNNALFYIHIKCYVQNFISVKTIHD